ncbi:MAG: MBOAT family protein [Lachnospiraceae bacterium]|nr:MBOAT family protein [Lachnospiraceae bacterium]
MLFNSLPFLFFFPAVVICYYLIPQKYRYLWLLFCSYFFYACQEQSFTVLLMISTVITWSAGRLVYNAKSLWYKKLYVAVGFFLNLFILFYFKYSGLIFMLTGRKEGINLMLPAGISFYTFQSLSYIMDCYREEVKPENNILKYALFVSFFPCILSGPIERSKNFLPRIGKEVKWDSIRIKEGLFLMLWGYFLKMVIVSRLDILVDQVYGGGRPVGETVLYRGIPMLIAMFAYSFYIYCDFAGYSFIAIGAARILGFDVMRNFRQPYLAVSVADFWRRWHISLSTWFRDYLYIPLGGGRKGTLRRYINIIIVFGVSGIWHGATLNFLIWGLLHGIYQVVGYMLLPVRRRLSDKLFSKGHERIEKILNMLFTYVCVSVAWMFFREKDLSLVIDQIGRTFSGIRLTELIDGTLFDLGLGVNNLVFVIASLLILITVDLICEKKDCEIYSIFNTAPVWIRWGFYYILFIMILFSTNLSTREFLYQGF